MSDELKPCPFCAGRAEIHRGAYTKYVMCLKCEVMGPNLTARAEITFAWRWPVKIPAMDLDTKVDKVHKSSRGGRRRSASAVMVRVWCDIKAASGAGVGWSAPQNGLEPLQFSK